MSSSQQKFEYLNDDQMFNMCEFFIQLGLYQEALSYCATWVLQQDKDVSYKMYVIRAKALYHLGREEEAVQDLKEALGKSAKIGMSEFNFVEKYLNEIQTRLILNLIGINNPILPERSESTNSKALRRSIQLSKEGWSKAKECSEELDKKAAMEESNLNKEKSKSPNSSKEKKAKKKKNKKKKETQAQFKELKSTNEIEENITIAKKLCESLTAKITNATELEQKFKKATKSLDAKLVDPIKDEILQLVDAANFDFNNIKKNIGISQTNHAKKILDQSQLTNTKLEEIGKNTKALYDSFTAKMKHFKDAENTLTLAQNAYIKYKEQYTALNNLSVLENKDLPDDSLEKAEELKKACEEIINTIRSHIAKANFLLAEISKDSQALKPIRDKLKKIKLDNPHTLQRKVDTIKQHLESRDKINSLQKAKATKSEEIKKALKGIKNSIAQVRKMDKIAKSDMDSANERAKKLEEVIDAVEEKIKQCDAIEKDLNSYLETPVIEDFKSQRNFLLLTKRSIQDEMKARIKKHHLSEEFNKVWNDIQEQINEYEKKQNELILLSKVVQNDKDDPFENSLEKAKKLKAECESIANYVQSCLAKGECILNELNESLNITIQPKLKKVEHQIHSQDLQKLQEEVNIIDKHLAERQEGKNNLDNFLAGTQITSKHIDFLFELAEEFPVVMYGSAVIAKDEKRVGSVGDMDIRILVDESLFEQKKLQLTRKDRFVEDTKSAGNVFFKMYTKYFLDSKLEIHLTYGRSNGSYQYVGDELILPSITGQLLFSKTPLVDHLNYLVGSNRFFCIKQSQVFLDWRYARQHPKEFWAFGYEKIASQKQKGYLNIIVKQKEKMCKEGLLDEKELKKVSVKKSLSYPNDASYDLYSWGAIVQQWTSPKGIFATKMASSTRNDCYLEIHALVKERGIENKDAEPFVNAFFDALVDNHQDRKITNNSTISIRNEIIFLVKELYLKKLYPKTDLKTVVRQQFDFIAQAVLTYRQHYPFDPPDAGFMTNCISAIAEQSYPYHLTFRGVMGKVSERRFVTVSKVHEEGGEPFTGDISQRANLENTMVFDNFLDPRTQRPRILSPQEVKRLRPEILAQKWVQIDVEQKVYGNVTVSSPPPIPTTQTRSHSIPQSPTTPPLYSPSMHSLYSRSSVVSRSAQNLSMIENKLPTTTLTTSQSPSTAPLHYSPTHSMYPIYNKPNIVSRSEQNLVSRGQNIRPVTPITPTIPQLSLSTAPLFPPLYSFPRPLRSRPARNVVGSEQNLSLHDKNRRWNGLNNQNGS